MAAQRRPFERAPDQLPLRDDDIEARQDRELHSRRDRRIVLDLARDQHLQHQAALAVTDQHERATIVPRRKIVAPGGGDVAVCKCGRRIDVGAGGISGDRTERHLPVDGRERPAYGGEARELNLGRRFLLADVEIAVQPLVARYGGIDVETVERRVLRDLALACSAIAVGAELRRREGCRASVSAPGKTQPVSIEAVVHGSRLDLRRRGLGRCGRGNRDGPKQEQVTHYSDEAP